MPCWGRVLFRAVSCSEKEELCADGICGSVFDIQQDASQADCCVFSWEMLHVTEYGGLVHVFSCFSSPRTVVVFAVLRQGLTRKSGFMLLLEMILSNLVLEQVKLF